MVISLKRFELKLEHIKLLKRAYIRWEDGEFGAPSIDCKRPYGNSFVYADIAEILGINHVGEVFTVYQKDLMWKLHRGTETALQILVQTGQYRIGIYEAEDYTNDWKLVRG